MRHTLLLFDIDGTLINSAGSGGRAWRTASRRLFGEHFDFKGVNFAGRLDSAIYLDLALHNGITDHAERADDFWAAYLDELPREMARAAERIRACPGVSELLTRLRDEFADHVCLGLLTGNHQGAVPHKLGAIGIDHRWFAVGAFGDEAQQRPELTELCLQRYAAAHAVEPDPARVIVIGDTPHDIDCAKAHGCIAFGVATGSYDTEALTAAGADVVVPDLGDPTPLIALIEAHAGEHR
jgi:phosphoglycolate phosphatase-like HAD superfamily hydrolase